MLFLKIRNIFVIYNTFIKLYLIVLFYISLLYNYIANIYIYILKNSKIKF